MNARRLQLEGVFHELRRRTRRSAPPRRHGGVPEQATASMVCVSKRPGQLRHVLAIFDAQIDVTAELVLVTHAPGYADDARAAVDGRDDVTVVDCAPSISLGHALNLGVSRSSGDVVCKIDDDDRYSPDYVRRVLDALIDTQAGVVGQKSYFVHLEDRDETIVMFPDSPPGRVGRVAGGTIAAARVVFDHVAFPDCTLGEDVRFVRAAERAGFAVWSMPAGGYLQARSTSIDHTWTAGDDELLRSARRVGTGSAAELWH